MGAEQEAVHAVGAIFGHNVSNGLRLTIVGGAHVVGHGHLGSKGLHLARNPLHALGVALAAWHTGTKGHLSGHVGIGRIGRETDRWQELGGALLQVLAAVGTPC